MADHSKPLTTSTYANFVTELDGRFDDITLGLDPAVTTPTNVPTNAIRWNSASNKWQKYDGSTWNNLSSTYDFTAITGTSLNISGNTTLGDASGDTVTLNASTVSIPNGLNFDSNTFVIDATNNRVGIGTSSPASRLAVTETSTTAGSADIVRINTASGGNFNISCSDLSASVPSWTIQTGSSEPLIFAQSSTERMRIDASGNLGLGVAPSAWGSQFKPLELGRIGSSVVAQNNNSSIYLTSNGYYNGTSWTYANSSVGAANFIIGNGGAFYWDLAGSGTAGNAITYTRAMTLDASGNLGIGTSSPSYILETANTVAGDFRGFSVNNKSTNTSGQSSLSFNTANDGTADRTRVVLAGFASATGNDGVFTISNRNAGTITERMRIDASGNLGLGVTPYAWSSAWRSLDIGNSTSIMSYISSTPNASVFANNYYYNGTNYVYKNTGYASNYGQNNGIHYWNIAPSGTAGNAITFTQAMTLDASGNLGIGTSSPTEKLSILGGASAAGYISLRGNNNASSSEFLLGQASDGTTTYVFNRANGVLVFGTNNTERMRINSSGVLLVGKTADNTTDVGCVVGGGGYLYAARSANTPLAINRLVSDGTLVNFYQDSTIEGTISVAGTTVSYNGGHLARYAQTVGAKDESLLKGTVLSNLDEMNTYVDEEGNPVANEQLNKVKVSDVEGDADVAGVFVNWSYDEQHSVDEINMAMTGDMIIRIAEGVTVARGDLLMSAGDGTAKPQGDDIVRSKTIAKVTSTNITCTYADGSYCVPCVLMAC